jgi:hypothetical protein
MAVIAVCAVVAVSPTIAASDRHGLQAVGVGNGA